MLPVNRGKGAAVRAGMLAARGRTVAFTDADLSYSPDHLIELLEQVEAGWDVVVGSRRHDDTTTLVRARRVREIGGRAINLLTRIVLLGKYRDTQCGLKAFRSDVAQVIFGHSRIDGFAFDVEVFHLVEAYQLSLAEVPVRVVNSSRSTVHVVPRRAAHGPRPVPGAPVVGAGPLRPRARRGRAGGAHARGLAERQARARPRPRSRGRPAGGG